MGKGGCREAVLAFLLARAGAFADEAASTLYVNQLRAGGTAFENLQSRRRPPPPPPAGGAGMHVSGPTGMRWPSW